MIYDQHVTSKTIGEGNYFKCVKRCTDAMNTVVASWSYPVFTVHYINAAVQSLSLTDTQSTIYFGNK